MERVARRDVLLASTDHRFVRGVVDVDVDRAREARGVGQRERREADRGVEVDACTLDVGLRLGGDGDRLTEIVEDDDCRAAEEPRGGADVAFPPTGHFFEGMNDVPRHISDLGTRKAFGRRGRGRTVVARKERRCGFERIGDAAANHAARLARHRPSAPRQDRVCARPIAENRIAPPPLARDDALEEKRRAVAPRAPQRRVGADRREGVGDEREGVGHARPNMTRARAGSAGARPTDRAKVAARATSGALPSESTPFER